jgi:hypothetical protein
MGKILNKIHEAVNKTESDRTIHNIHKAINKADQPDCFSNMRVRTPQDKCYYCPFFQECAEESV